MNDRSYRGKIRYFTEPPETEEMTSSAIVTAMSKEFDLDALLGQEQADLDGNTEP